MKRPVFEFRHAWTLALLGGLLASVGGAFLGVEVGSTLEERALLEAERALIEPPRLLFEAVRHTQAHRRLASQVLDGDLAVEPLRATRQHEVDAAIARLAAALDRSPLFTGARADWAAVDERWKGLAEAVTARRLSAQQSSLEHGVLIQAQLDVHDRLSVDGLEFTNRWEASLWEQTPHLVESLEQARGNADPALQARVEAWVEALAPALHARAPAPVQAAFELALRQWRAGAPGQGQDLRPDPPGVTVTEGLRDRDDALAAAIAAVLEADIRWQQERLAQRREDNRKRLQAVSLAASALVLLLLASYLGLHRLQRAVRHQTAETGAAAAREQGPNVTPAMLGQRLLGSLRRRVLAQDAAAEGSGDAAKTTAADPAAVSDEHDSSQGR